MCSILQKHVLSLTLKTVVGQLGYKFYHSVILSQFWAGPRDVIGRVTITAAVGDGFL